MNGNNKLKLTTMKRFLISMAALLAVVGCAKQEDLVSADFGSTNAPMFKVGIEDTRVGITEDGDGFKLYWVNDDRFFCILHHRW